MSMDDYEKQKDAILRDPSASFWLKTAVWDLDRRDPVDALEDLEVLMNLCQVRCTPLWQSSVEDKLDTLKDVLGHIRDANLSIGDEMAGHRRLREVAR
jgi:hypothetical protein